MRLDSILLLLLLFSCVWSIEKARCEDLDKKLSCIAWKNAGYCTSGEYQQYMTVQCNATCEICPNLRPTCNSEKQFECPEGYPNCVPILKMCDGVRDCQDGFDETDCDWLYVHNNNQENVSNFDDVSTPPLDHITDQPREGENATVDIQHEKLATEPVTSALAIGVDCPSRHSPCRKANRCIRDEFWCDGWVDDCGDGEDEKAVFCYKRPNREFIKAAYMKNITVGVFFASLLGMKHTHCTERAFSCRDACTSTVNLDSYLCACDPDCYARKDCCYDVDEVCEYRKDLDLRDLVTEKCVPTIFGNGTAITALLVESCPLTATERDSRLCLEASEDGLAANENANVGENFRYFGAPVYSAETERHYRNYYCARCNGATGVLSPWNVWYDCQSTKTNLASDDCTGDRLMYVPPPSIVKTCRIRDFKDPIFEDHTARVEQREAVKRCKDVYAPVMYNDTLYRNPYCVYMHRAQVHDQNKSRLYTCDIESKIPEACPEGTTPCRSTFTCIPEEKICDGMVDCPDESDEPREHCMALKKECYGKFTCKRTQHECMETTQVCDGFQQCTDHSDEDGCPDHDQSNEIEYREDIYYTLPELANYPTISNNYEETEEEDAPDGLTLKKEPMCVEPLVFDGIKCKYNRTLTTDNQDYQKVYMKQELTTETYNITLEHTGHFRPASLGDNPPVFLTKYIGQHPYQIVNYFLAAPSSNGNRQGFLSFRMLTQLEQSEHVRKFVQSGRDKENFLQIENVVYQISKRRGKTEAESQQPNTQIDCQYDHSGPLIQVICTGCAYISYSSHEYTISSGGSLMLNSNGQVLQYYEYELRENNSILLCWDTPNSNATEVVAEERSKWLMVWFGTGYVLAFFGFIVALSMNLYYGRKTTLRIFLINYTAMGIIWSFDSLICSVSTTYSTALESLHLYGCLGMLAWLIIVSFHLLMSVTDGNPAVYFSVDNLVYYHVCGWLCPLAWILFFFILSKFKVIEAVVSLTNPCTTPDIMNQSSDILHFPIWVVILVILFLLLIVIGTTKRLMNSKKSHGVSLDILKCRLEIKTMIFFLFLLASVPWIFNLVLKYLQFDRSVQFLQLNLSNIAFCLDCVLQALFLIYLLQSIVQRNLEKLQSPSPSPQLKISFPIPEDITAEKGPSLPPKQARPPRPPSYQHPVSVEYTPFPDHRTRQGKEKYARVPDVDQYSHLQGGVLGGGGAGRAKQRKDYYPLTTCAPLSAAVPPFSAPQYRQLQGSGAVAARILEASSPHSSRSSPQPSQARSRQRTASDHSLLDPAAPTRAVPPEPVYKMGKPKYKTSSGKHRMPRSLQGSPNIAVKENSPGNMDSRHCYTPQEVRGCSTPQSYHEQYPIQSREAGPSGRPAPTSPVQHREKGLAERPAHAPTSPVQHRESGLAKRPALISPIQEGELEGVGDRPISPPPSYRSLQMEFGGTPNECVGSFMSTRSSHI